MNYIKRSLEPVLARAIRQFPVLVLTGPRQSGKTTLLRRVFRDTHRYVSLDPPEIRAGAAGDPRGFLELHPPPVIFDEVQYAPDLLSYIKVRVDENRQQRGQYILTGSQDLLLTQGVTQSLAGRTAILRLLPLTAREAASRPDEPLPWEPKKAPARPGFTYAALWRRLLRGSYPELAASPALEPALWYGAYIQTYMERDVRSLRQVGDLLLFQAFLRALAARSAQLLSLSDVARDLGIAVNTVKAWVSVLLATYQILLLRPYFVNVGKRLVKTPKLYFTDTGTLCYLAGLRDAGQAMASPMAGAILETAVVSEIFRTILHRGEEPWLYFWRTSNGVEVDLIVDTGTALAPVEVKLSATPNQQMARGIESFRKDFGSRVAKGFVIHPGDVKIPLSPAAIALPFAEL